MANETIILNICEMCGLMTNAYFRHCPGCGTNSKKIQEEYTRVIIEPREIKVLKEG